MSARAILAITALAFCTASASAQRYNPPDPKTERATMHYRNGWELMRHEAWVEAVREFEAAIDSDPKYTLAYYGLGRAYMPQRRYVEAIKAYITCRDQYVARVSERYSSQQEADRKRQDELTGLKEILRINSTGPETIQTQNAQRQIRNRMRQIQDNLDREPSTITFDASVPAFVSVALGSDYFRANRFVDAEREYKAALEVDDKAGEAHNNLAVVYMLTDRFDESEREMKLAEKSGFQVNPGLKQDLADRRRQKQ